MLKPAFGPLFGKTVCCIYELKGDEMRLCFPMFGTDRPTELSAGAGSGRILLTFSRVEGK